MLSDFICRINPVEINTFILLHNQSYYQVEVCHILEELAKIAKDYAIINEGRIIEESTLEDLKLKCRDKIVIKTSNTSPVLPILDSNNFSDYQVIDSNTIYIYERLGDISTLNMEIAKAEIPVESIGVQSSDLEEYFIKLTGASAGGIK